MPDQSLKRERDIDDDVQIVSPPSASPQARAGVTANPTTNFRNVSACNRCRRRKNRCDQKLPRCTGCKKAGEKCVGFDPVSKRTIPRSYVYYLETRVKKLEALLQANSIPFEPPEDDFSISEAIRPGFNVPFPVQDEESPPSSPQLKLDPTLQADNNDRSADPSMSEIGADLARSDAEPEHLPSRSGIPFAKVVFAAVRSTVSHTRPDHDGIRISKPSVKGAAPANNLTPDAFFGLHTKPNVSPAPFPDKWDGQSLVDLYFEHANPQIPILHRLDFVSIFDRVYALDAKDRLPRELFLINVVFAIGSGIIVDSANPDRVLSPPNVDLETPLPTTKRVRLTAQQYQPEEYHASAMMHLGSFLNSLPVGKASGGGLEELQAVLLLAGLALLRPVAPGLWYIIGVAVRLAVDLGLHSEDGDGLGGVEQHIEATANNGSDHKQWTRDLRRRLWWCVYSFDRLVSTCVLRPFGITDQVVTTEFPSPLDDKFIAKDGLARKLPGDGLPSYKLVSHHYFRLRLLQSEILGVLQHRQAEQARARGANRSNPYIHKALLSPFKDRFATFKAWRIDVEGRLWDWKQSAPKKHDIGVAFNPLFLELNYWQALIMLYRHSVAVPEPLAGEVNLSTDSSGAFQEAREDEEIVFMKVAQAGQRVLKIYRQLHLLKLVNYTYLATHHLFMSGISFLYAVWHSPLVRSQLTLEDVDFTVLAATSVLNDLTAKCPPAEACKVAFLRMSKATIAMVEKTTGFGSASTLASQRLNAPGERRAGEQIANDTNVTRHQQPRAWMPQFDMDLRGLFSEEEIAGRPLARQLKAHLSEHRIFQAQEPIVSLSEPAPTESVHIPNAMSHILNDEDEATFTPHFATSPSLHHPISNQSAYQPFAQTLAQTQPDFSYDSGMSFIDDFPLSDFNAQGDQGSGWNDFDMSFATGGTGGVGWDGGGDWDSSNVDMFGGFFFGGDGAQQGNGGM